MVTYLRDYGIPLAQHHGLRSSVCFWGGRIHPQTYDIASMADDVGVSIAPEYRENTMHTRMWADYIWNLAQMNDKTTSIWFPGYNIPAGEEDYIIGDVKFADGQMGIDNLATWGFRGCEAWSYARCERPDVMWDTIGQAFRSIV